MMQPQSNGLFEVATAKPQKERGFCCMKLIRFLTEDSVSSWDDWHGAHKLAAVGRCQYKDKCSLHAQTFQKQLHRGIQLELF